MNKKKKENLKESHLVQGSSIEEKITKISLESNFDISRVEGTEAYYSERYGWTLRRPINSKL